MIEKDLSFLHLYTEKELRKASEILSKVALRLKSYTAESESVHDAALLKYRTGESRTMEEAFAQALGGYLSQMADTVSKQAK